MKGRTLVKSIMTPFPYSVALDDELVTAKMMMDDHGIRHLPVTRDGDIVGAISEHDVRIAGSVGGSGPTSVREVCSMPAYVVDLNDLLHTVLLEMAERQITSAIVVRAGKLSGILTTTDVLRAFGRRLKEEAGLSDEDDASA